MNLQHVSRVLGQTLTSQTSLTNMCWQESQISLCSLDNLRLGRYGDQKKMFSWTFFPNSSHISLLAKTFLSICPYFLNFSLAFLANSLFISFVTEVIYLFIYWDTWLERILVAPLTSWDFKWLWKRFEKQSWARNSFKRDQKKPESNLKPI